MFTIDKGVPLPPKASPRKSNYPFHDMVPGDSFAIPLPEGRLLRTLRSRTMSYAADWAKRHAPGSKFETRSENDGNALRIWLVSKPQSLATLVQPMARPPPVTGRVHKLVDDEPSKRRSQPSSRY
jgi:hypothetical protein